MLFRIVVIGANSKHGQYVAKDEILIWVLCDVDRW